MPEGWQCPICDRPLTVRHAADGTTPIGRACGTHGVISRVLPEGTTMDLTLAPGAKADEIRDFWGYDPTSGEALPNDELPAEHPRRDQARMASVEQTISRPVTLTD